MTQVAAEALSRFSQFAFRHPNFALALVLMLSIVIIGVAVAGTFWLIAYPTLPKVFCFFAIIIAALLCGLTRR